MDIQNVTVCGSGVLGAQIAFQAAMHGFNVTVYDINQEVLGKLKGRFLDLGELYKKDIQSSAVEVTQAIRRISYTTDLAAALTDADLVIEAIPENMQVKTEFYMQLGKLAPKKTIFTTNSSTFLPGQLAGYTGRPEKFLALHFANMIWKNNTAEIMGHAGTDARIFDTVVAFARAIGMVPLPLLKESPGYILNSLQIPYLLAAMNLYANGIADPYTIDKTWMIAMGSPMGPFAIFDQIGFTTAYNIAMNAAAAGDEAMRKGAMLLKDRFIDKGKLGMATGEGFYKYPNPSYESDDFIR